MHQLTLDNVTKRFGKQTVLSSFSLEVPKGAFVALLGPSGCGKSTLLRMIAGLESLNEGSISIAGRDVSRLPPERRNVALMFQSYALLPHMSVFENVRFPLRMRGSHNRDVQNSKVEDTLTLVHLEAFANRRPRQLSGGQQQRVALARAIVAEPNLLLLDEPLSNLDARLREDMQVELMRLHKQLGLTTVFVTHDQSEALALADHVVLMNHGRIEQQGPPEEVYSRPRTVFAAEFIGGANILTMDVRRSAKTWLGCLPDGTSIKLANDPEPRPGPSKFMLRKEAVKLSPVEGMVKIPALIEGRNYLGSHVRSVINAGGQTLIAVSTPGEARLDTERLEIGWMPEDLLPLEDE